MSSTQSNEKRVLTSIEDASILRKFTVLFLLMSIIPTTILFYFYIQIKNSKTILLNADDINLTLIIVVIGVAVGYIAMRSVLKKIMMLTAKNTEALTNLLDPQQLEELKSEHNEVTALSKSFNVVIKSLETNVKVLESTKRKLHMIMAKVGHGIVNMQKIDTFLELILETVTNALGGRIGVLMMVDTKLNEIWVTTVYGTEHQGRKNKRIKIEEGTTIATVVKAKQPLMIPRMIMPGLEDENTKSSLFDPPLVCAPLIAHDKVKGIMTISGREENGNFGEDEMNLLYNLASQTAIALENSKLSDDIESAYFETIAALALAVDAKDKYSRGHLDRVAAYSLQIGEKLGLDDQELKILRDAAKLHDLGKIGIPDEVLQKTDPLTDSDWELMKKTP